MAAHHHRQVGEGQGQLPAEVETDLSRRRRERCYRDRTRDVRSQKSWLSPWWGERPRHVQRRRRSGCPRPGAGSGRAGRAALGDAAASPAGQSRWRDQCHLGNDTSRAGQGVSAVLRVPSALPWSQPAASAGRQGALLIRRDRGREAEGRLPALRGTQHFRPRPRPRRWWGGAEPGLPASSWEGERMGSSWP